MDIKRTTKKLMLKYGTNDPFKLSEQLGIVVRYVDIGDTWGFFFSYKRSKIIHINPILPYWLQRYTCAHELGHALLHKGVSTHFLKNHTLFSIERIERQANIFAVELLLSDDILEQYSDISIHRLADIAGIPNGLETLKNR